MKDFMNSIITSSADPAKTSLAVQGTLVMIGAMVLHVATAACTFGLYCLGIDQAWVNQIIDGVTNLAYLALALIGSLMTFLGLMRKIRLGRWSASE